MPNEPAMGTWIFLAERSANPAVGIPPISPGQIERLHETGTTGVLVLEIKRVDAVSPEVEI